MASPTAVLRGLPRRVLARLPFSASTTPLQAATYLCCIALFSISFLVFLNSAVSFVITDLLGVKTGVGDIVGTLGFADELVALVACPLWGLVSDRLGVRWVAVLGYLIVGAALVLFVQAKNVYPQLVLARVLFAAGASAAATMVTAILPSLTADSQPSDEEGLIDDDTDDDSTPRPPTSRRRQRNSIALSVESELTITPERFTRVQQLSRSSATSRAGGGVANGSSGVITNGHPSHAVKTSPTTAASAAAAQRRPSALAGFVGVFTGLGALLALALFLPLPASFARLPGWTMAQAVAASFYVVAAVAWAVAAVVFLGLRGLRGEEGKGWRALLAGASKNGERMGRWLGRRGRRGVGTNVDEVEEGPRAGWRRWSQRRRRRGPAAAAAPEPAPTSEILPYSRLLRDSIVLGLTDPDIALGYLGGFVARASTVAISLFVPLFVNSFFIDNGFCRGSPNDPSPELKKECRAAYVLASMLTGVAQLMGLLAAPVFGYLSSRVGAGSHGGGTGIAAINWPVAVATVFGVIGYIAFPRLPSPEPSDKDGRGGSPVVFLIVSLLGISQIGAIVCSLGSLGRGVLAADQDSAAVTSAADVAAEAGLENGQDVVDNGDDLTSTPEDAPLLPHTGAPTAVAAIPVSSRIRLKGSIAGVYSLCGGAAILLLTKLGGYLFDSLAKGAPFYMMAIFNAVLLAVSLAIDLAHVFRRKA